MKRYPKPRYRLGQKIVGTVYHLAEKLPSVVVMVEIESARYDTQYGHWIYSGCVYHTEPGGVFVDIYEWDVERKVK